MEKEKALFDGEKVKDYIEKAKVEYEKLLAKFEQEEKRKEEKHPK